MSFSRYIIKKIAYAYDRGTGVPVSAFMRELDGNNFNYGGTHSEMKKILEAMVKSGDLIRSDRKNFYIKK